MRRVEIRDKIELGAGRIWWVSDAAAARLRRSGSLIPTGEAHLPTSSSATRPARQPILWRCWMNREPSRPLGGLCLFRGQTRDYLDDQATCGSCAPTVLLTMSLAAHRTQTLPDSGLRSRGSPNLGSNAYQPGRLSDSSFLRRFSSKVRFS